MKIIAIWGPAEAGKSTTCRIVLTNLKESGFIVQNYDEDENGDFKALIQFGNILIGLFSAGDDVHTIAESISFAEINKCDVLINTIRRYTKYTSVLKEEENEVYWIELVKENDMGRKYDLEMQKANEILDLLKES